MFFLRPHLVDSAVSRLRRGLHVLLRTQAVEVGGQRRLRRHGCAGVRVDLPRGLAVHRTTPPPAPASLSRRSCSPGWAPATTALSLHHARRPAGAVQRRCRLPARSAVGDLAAVRHRRGHAHPHLFDGLHGARRRLLPLLRLPEPVHVLHADADPGQQLCPDVRRLGGRGPVLVPADRLLLPAALGVDRGEQGVHHQPHRRCRIPAGHVHHRLVLRLGAVHAGEPAGAQRALRDRRSAGSPPPACCCSSEPAASRRNSRCMSGCRTRWKVRRRSRR